MNDLPATRDVALTSATTYRVFARDNVVYGPIELLTLIQWVTDERIRPETWVLRLTDDQWVPAACISELHPEFEKVAARPREVSTTPAAGEVLPEELRQFTLFAGV